MFALFLGLFQPILALNEATMVFFNFFNFFAIFFEFSFTHRVGTERNDNTYFHSFPTRRSSDLFFPIFLKFSIMRQVGMEWNRTTIFIFSRFRPIPTYYGLK